MWWLLQSKYAVKIQVIWILTLWIGCQHFGVVCCAHLQGSSRRRSHMEKWVYAVLNHVLAYFTKIKTEYLILSANKWCLKFSQSQYIHCLNIHFLWADPFYKSCVQKRPPSSGWKWFKWELGHGEPWGLAIQSQWWETGDGAMGHQQETEALKGGLNMETTGWQFMTCPLQEAFTVSSWYEWEVSLMCSRRNWCPYSYYWNEFKSLSLLWSECCWYNMAGWFKWLLKVDVLFGPCHKGTSGLSFINLHILAGDPILAQCL